MRRIFIDKKGISNVLGYLFSFAIASLVMISAVLLTTSIIEDRIAKVGNMEAQSIANKIADGIIEAVAVGESTSDMDYNKVLDIPTDIAGRNYYVEVTDRAVYVNTTDGLVSKSCPTYGAESSKIGLSRGKFYGGSGKINITLNKPDVAYRFDFGTGNITSHSPVESGYYMVTNTSSTDSTRCDPPWWNAEYKARVPILVENDSPENLIDVPIKMVLSSSSFDYSLANVTVDSSSEVTSNLMFIDPSRQIFAKINIITSTWDPSWFYTYYDPPNPTYVEVKIMELSGGYNASYIDGATIKLKANGETLATSWNSNTGVAQFNAIKALEILETGGTHFLSSPTYTVSVYGLLKNGLEFSGSGTTSIKGAKYVSPTGNKVITNFINNQAQPGDTIFVRSGTYSENIVINKNINLIGESRSSVTIGSALSSGGKIIWINSQSYVNIDSLTLSSNGFNRGIVIDSGSQYINITKCKISSCRNGIKVLSSSNVGISDCITHSSSGEEGTSEDGDGIDIESASKVRITDCESYLNNNKKGDGFHIYLSSDVILIDCLSRNNNGEASMGILIMDSHDCKILDSIISGNNGPNSDGIRIDVTPPVTTNWCYNNLIKNCTITDNNNVPGEGCGINFRGNGPREAQGYPMIGNNTAEDCKISGNYIGVLIAGEPTGTEGITAASEYNNVIRCDIHDNLHEGILILEYITGLCWYNNITYCNVYNNGLTYGCDGVYLYGSFYNRIEHCNIFDNGDDGLQLGGTLTEITGFYWSNYNTIRYNNFYCNGKSSFSGTGVYCKAATFGVLGSHSNIITNNNFGYDYAYKQDCVDYNFKYAVDDNNWNILNPEDMNIWNNNFWDNWDGLYGGGGAYFIPDSDFSNAYGNDDPDPRTSRNPNPDYIIVTPAPPAQQTVTVTISGTADTADSYVSGKLGGGDWLKNFGDKTYMWVDPYICLGFSQVNRIFIKFDLSEIPPVQNVISAKLWIYYREKGSWSQDPADRTHQCRRVTGPWAEYIINWNNKPGSTPTTSRTLGSSLNWKDWTVTTDVANFLSGSQINRGWEIKDSNEGSPDCTYYSAKYDSKEGSSQPYLEIVYTPASNDPGPHYHPRTIAKGIANVIQGGTVYVKENFTAGKLNPYPERFTISKELKLIGEDRDNVIIDGKNGGDIISITSQNVVIDSFNIRNGSNAGINIAPSIAPDVTKPINITNCKINNTLNGILLSYSYVNIKNCEIYDNSASGISIYSNINDRGDFNSILNCNIHDNANYGINLGPSGSSFYCDSNTITHCNVYGSDKGINIYKGRNNFIENCSIYNNNDGIRLQNSGSSSNSNNIKYCNINNNGNGIHLLASSDYNVIKKCEIYQNTQDGIKIETAHYNNILKCNINDNTNFGIEITEPTSSNNKIYHNKFINNNASDKGTNTWDDGYPSGGNLWSNYDEEPEDARDYLWGQRTDGNDQPYSGSDGIADSPYNIPGGSSKDLYPWCRKPAEMPYYIDYWNPYGESVILVNTSLANHTSKYIYLYYGYSGSLSENPKYKHNMSDVSVFSDDFSGTDIDFVNKWNFLGGTIPVTLDGKGNLSFGAHFADVYIITKNNIIPEIGEPIAVPNSHTINQSMYVVEARMNLNKSEGNMFVLNPWPTPFQAYWIAVNTAPGIRKFTINNEGPGLPGLHKLDEISIPDINQWIRLKTYIYRAHEKFKTTSQYTNESQVVNIASIIYNSDSYADQGNVSCQISKYRILNGNWINNPIDVPLYTGGSIGLGESLSDLGCPGKVLVDWIRVMKTPVIPPTITVGPVESVNYGWDNPGVIHSKNIVLPRQQPSDDPFYPGPVLRDFNYGSHTQPGIFNISNLPGVSAGEEYTITITIGNASGACNATTVEFKDNLGTSYGTLTIPATEAGKFETKSLLITWYGGNLLAEFSSAIGDWTVNSMIIERGKKGIHVGLE